MDSVLRLNNVWKRYGEVQVLRGIDLSVDAKELVLIKGRSGVGKSTLCRIAALLMKPDEGRVEFMGRRVDDLGDVERSRLRMEFIGYVDQELSLIPTISVLDNVTLPLRLMGIPKRIAVEKALEILRVLELQGKEFRLPKHLSAGERQRVVIARALIKNPRLLVLDEPTSCLDEYTAEIVMSEITKHVKVNSAAAIMTTTDMGLSIGDRMYILRDGALIRV